MTEDPHTTPRWIVAILRDDFNWWTEQTSEEMGVPRMQQGLLDPGQIAHLTRELDAYREYGIDPEVFTNAFQTYRIESELDDQRVRLTRSDENIYNTGEKLFALPLGNEEGSGAYFRLVDMLSVARVQMLNRTHHYVRDCTEEDMYQELNAIDADRFFSDQSLHVFEELNEILQWRPAEWEDSES